MFTGITHDKYAVIVAPQTDGIIKLELDLGDYGDGIRTGASVAINGVCLTVVEAVDHRVIFDVGGETARISNLSELSNGSFVNVERSFRVGDEIGGHILSGHVADVVTVTRNEIRGSEAQLEFEVSIRWRPYLMPKGFVALNGCSLTVADFDRESGVGTVNLIPETLRRTNFDGISPGDHLNLEVDSQTQAVVDTVRSMMRDKTWLASLE